MKQDRYIGYKEFNAMYAIPRSTFHARVAAGDFGTPKRVWHGQRIRIRVLLSKTVAWIENNGRPMTLLIRERLAHNANSGKPAGRVAEGTT